MQNNFGLDNPLAFQVGAPAPDFSLPCVLGEQASTCARQDLLGRPWVLFIYPKDNTCDCTLVAQNFRDLHTEFEALGVQVLGLSRDSVGAHKKFIAAQSFPFALISDSSQETMKSWGLIYAATMYGKPVTKVRRTTVLVDAAGMVARVWEKVAPNGHALEVLEACKYLRRS
jgi:peroxiredoxin Q/BCP